MTSTTTSASETRFRSASELGKLDLGKLLEAKSDSFLRPMQERAEAGIQKFKPITVEERLRSFQKIGYRPHGLFLPNDEEMQDIVRRHMVRVGAIESEDERLATYFKLQAETDKLCTRGVPGHWTGQMGVARSPAPYRIVAWGRRGGKSFHAAREAVGVAVRQTSFTHRSCGRRLRIRRLEQNLTGAISKMRVGTSTSSSSRKAGSRRRSSVLSDTRRHSNSLSFTGLSLLEPEKGFTRSFV